MTVGVRIGRLPRCLLPSCMRSGDQRLAGIRIHSVSIDLHRLRKLEFDLFTGRLHSTVTVARLRKRFWSREPLCTVSRQARPTSNWEIRPVYSALMTPEAETEKLYEYSQRCNLNE